MAIYTDIPTVEEGTGLISNVKEVAKKDPNFYLKSACVGLLMVVAYMSGSNRNLAGPEYEKGSLLGSSMNSLKLFPTVCTAVSSVNPKGFCKKAAPGCSENDLTGYPECTQIGGGRNGCIPFPVAPAVARAATMFSGLSDFPQEFVVKSCEDLGFPKFSRDLDISKVRGGLPDSTPGALIPSTIVGVYEESNPICPADVKICPDGFPVSRVGPGCEFAECPSFTVCPAVVCYGPNGCQGSLQGPNCDCSCRK